MESNVFSYVGNQDFRGQLLTEVTLSVPLKNWAHGLSLYVQFSKDLNIFQGSSDGGAEKYLENWYIKEDEWFDMTHIQQFEV